MLAARRRSRSAPMASSVWRARPGAPSPRLCSENVHPNLQRAFGAAPGGARTIGGEPSCLALHSCATPIRALRETGPFLTMASERPASRRSSSKDLIFATDREASPNSHKGGASLCGLRAATSTARAPARRTAPQVGTPPRPDLGLIIHGSTGTGAFSSIPATRAKATNALRA